MRTYLLKRPCKTTLFPQTQPQTTEMTRPHRPHVQPPSSGTTIADDDVPMHGIENHLLAKNKLDEGYQSANSIPTPDTAEMPNPQESELHLVGKSMKVLFDTINQLEQLGVENLEIPLPKIVVVGDQSAGKSSLIEAISGIKVPRASGTCTRCPLQINLTPDDAGAHWVCQVTLHKKYDYYGHLSQAEFSEQFPNADLWPWALKHTPEDTPFKLVRNRGDIEETLKRAQRAILNPQENPAVYASGKESDKLEASFSPNIVRLDISSPGLPNLSFYDLPGVINQTEIMGDSHFVKIVKKLAKYYIRDDNAIVLLCCSMEGDLANSTASRIVRTSGAERRAMGVLTKPDRAPHFGPDQFKSLKTVLEGDTFELAYNYYVTKQPSQRDLDEGIDHITARQAERRYFETDDLWKTQLAQFKDRFGTDRIQSTLSDLLADQILRNLPRITHQVQAKIASLDEELAAMPDPPADDSVRIVYEILQNCHREITNNMVGERPYHNFKLEWKAQVKKFSEALYAMRPTLVVRSKSESAQSNTSNSQSSSSSPAISRESVPINLDSDLEQEERSPTLGRKRQQAVPVTPSKRQRTAQPAGPACRRSGAFNSNQTPGRFGLYTYTSSPEFAKRLTVDDIRRTIDEANTSGVPGQVDPKAVDHLISSTVQHWDKPVTEFVRQTEELLHDTIHSTLTKHTQQWASTGLAKNAKATVNSFLRSSFETICDSAKRIVALELSKPITFNEESLDACRQKELSLFRNARHDARAGIYVDELEFKSGKVSEGQDRQKKIKQVTAEQLGPDPFTTEVEVMSRVRGYYTVAMLRLVDHLAQIMLVELFENCKENLHHRLQQDLGVNSRDAMDRCQRLLAENPEREALRMQKKKEKERLLGAQAKLNALNVLA